MNKKDKKFIAALVFLQTGVLATVISASGSYWHDQVNECKRIAGLAELSNFMNNTINKAESNHKIKDLKQHYQTKGVRAEEH